jgi:hypothetical protein
MEELVEGFRRLREEAFPPRKDLFQKLAHAESPHTLCVGRRRRQSLATNIHAAPNNFLLTRDKTRSSECMNYGRYDSYT